MKKTQEKTLSDMQESTDVVHTVSADDAQDLVNEGYARYANVSPAPEGKQVAINLTTKGRSFKNSAPEPDAAE